VQRGLRPLEWALLGFFGFVLVRVGPAVFLEWRELAGLRTVTVFFALALVGFVSLSLESAALPWPAEVLPLRPLWRLSLVPAALPLVAFLGLAVSSLELRHTLETTRAAQRLAVLSTLVLRVVGFGLPTLFLWVAVGLEAKTAGRVVPRHLVQVFGRRLLAAVREWSPLLIILSAYAWMDAVVGGKLGEGRDALMASVDRALFLGVDPQDLLQPLIWAPLSEWLAFCYSMYAVLFPLVLGVVAFKGGPGALRVASWPIGVGLLIAYVSYSLVPVEGPLLHRHFDVPLDLYVIGPVKEAMMDATRITWDCFPSMHTCCTVLLGWAAWRFARRLFWALSPVIVSIPCACVYLRYHYVIDVLAGLALAAMLIASTRWVERRRSGWLTA
jgi:hypothetical protein